MYSVLIGSFILSVLHAVIPNHWLPIIAIGKKEHWATAEVTKVTLFCALAHGLSTILIGVILAFLGAGLGDITQFTRIIAPVILVSLGIVFIYRHHRHKHFHLSDEAKKKKSKAAIITALVTAMFFSPCLEIEAYFLLAGTHSWWFVIVISLMYLLITIIGMVMLVKYVYKGMIKSNWHVIEHNAGVIAGWTLVITGVITFFIS